MTTLDLHQLDQIHIDKGMHDSPEQGHCLLEVVSMLAKEPFTDSPKCVSPYLRSFGISLNDRATDEQRQDLKQFIPLLVGTANDGLDEQRRWIGADFAIRTVAPRWLQRAGLTDHAQRLRDLPPITDDSTYQAARSLVYDARSAAWELRRERWQTLRETVYAAVLEKLSTSPANTPAAAATATTTTTTAATAAAAATTAATAAAAAATTAAAAAATTTDAAAKGFRRSVYDAVYQKVRPIYEARYADVVAEAWPEAVALFGRLINPSETS